MKKDFVYMNPDKSSQGGDGTLPGPVASLQPSMSVAGWPCDAGSAALENFVALEATRAVSQGLMAAIHDIARKKSAGPTCYTNAASMAQTRPVQPTAIAIDRSM